MGMCMSGGIFQAELDEILHYIEVLKTYIDDIMVLRKDKLNKHMDQMRVIFDRLCGLGLKFNAP